MPSGKSSGISTGQLLSSGSSQQMLGQTLQRVTLMIVNSGSPSSVFIGLSSAVTNTNGFEIKAGQTLTLDNYTGPAWVIGAASPFSIASWFEY